MKVNTDGVLLGAVTAVFPEDRTVLDVGTGTGTIALMLVQRLFPVAGDCLVQGIDIDVPSAEEASLNFSSSPWPSHLQAFHAGLASFEGMAEYDLIVSNPPFYDNSLQAPDVRRNSARHTRGGAADPEPLSWREILEYSRTHLSVDGRISLIVPADQETALLRYARMCGFAAWRILRIRTVPSKAPSRAIVQFKRKGNASVPAEEDELTLTDEKGKRTSRQASLLTDYLL